MGDYLQLIILVGGAVVIIVVAFGTGVRQKHRQTIEALEGLLEAYKEREELQGRQIQEMKTQHKTDIARLQGRIEVLESEWVRNLAREVGKEIRSILRDEREGKL